MLSNICNPLRIHYNEDKSELKDITWIIHELKTKIIK